MSFRVVFERQSSAQGSDVDPNDVLVGLASDEDKRVIAARAALRVLPSLDYFLKPVHVDEEPGGAVWLHALRTVFVAWAGLVYNGVRGVALAEASAKLNSLLAAYDVALAGFWERDYHGVDYATSSRLDRFNSARRAANLIQSIVTLEFQPLPFDQGWSQVDMFDTTTLYGPDSFTARPRWRAYQRAAIKEDGELLRLGMVSYVDLSLAPLWLTAEASAFATYAVPPQRSNFFSPYLDHWRRERKDGALVMSKSPGDVEEGVLALANSSSSFWEDTPPPEALRSFDNALRIAAH